MQYRGFCFKHGICIPWGYRAQEECLRNGDGFPNVGLNFNESEAFLKLFGRIIFMIVFLLNLFLIMANSSGAVPFGKHS